MVSISRKQILAGLMLLTISRLAAAALTVCTVTPAYTIGNAGDSVVLQAQCDGAVKTVNWKAGATSMSGNITLTTALPANTSFTYQTPRSLTGATPYTEYSVTATVTDDSATPISVVSAPVVLVVRAGPALTVAKAGAGAGTGTVASGPAGIDCGSTCTANFPSGASVFLTATPGASSVFEGWSGDCVGSGNCAVSMHGSHNVTATFSQVANGACGSATSSATTTPPTSNLCANGSAGNTTPNTSSYAWACTGTSGGTSANCSAPRAYTVSTSAGANGTLSPATATVAYNQTTAVTVTPASTYSAIMGGTCGGTLAGTTYTTHAVTADCTVSATFSNAAITGACGTANNTETSSAPTQNLCTGGTAGSITTNSSNYVWNCNGTNSGASLQCMAPRTYAITTTAGANGTISTNVTGLWDRPTQITVTPSPGYTATIATGTGTCGGNLSGTTYTTLPIYAGCTVSATFALTPVSTTDPGRGQGLWRPPGTTNIFVADQMGANGAGVTNFIPGCINNQPSPANSSVGCAGNSVYNGIANGVATSVSLAQGNVLSLRFNSKAVVNTFKGVRLSGGGGGSVATTTSLWISAVPPGTIGGNYEDVPTGCKDRNAGTPSVYTYNTSQYCAILPSRSYYVNVRAEDACSGSICRYQLEEVGGSTGPDLY